MSIGFGFALRFGKLNTVKDKTELDRSSTAVGKFHTHASSHSVETTEESELIEPAGQEELDSSADGSETTTEQASDAPDEAVDQQDG